MHDPYKFTAMSSLGGIMKKSSYLLSYLYCTYRISLQVQGVLSSREVYAQLELPFVHTLYNSYYW